MLIYLFSTSSAGHEEKRSPIAHPEKKDTPRYHIRCSNEFSIMTIKSFIMNEAVVTGLLGADTNLVRSAGVGLKQ